MIIKQVSAFLEDKSGNLNSLTKILADNHINLIALSMAESTDYGIVRMVVGQPEKAVQVLKEAGFSVMLAEVVCFKVPNKPGGLHKVLQILSDNDINLNYMYAFSTDEGAITVLKTSSAENTVKVLRENNVQIYCKGDIYRD